MKRSGAAPVPVVLTGLEEDAVAETYDFDRPALALAQADAFGDENGLAVWVRVPGRTCAGREVHRGSGERGGRLRCGYRVDVDIAGEPLGGPLLSFDVSCDVHDVSLVPVLTRAGWPGPP
jgi:hypothetical protein